MSDRIEVFKEWAEYVIDNNDWDNAEQYLRKLPPKFWRQAVIAIRHLLIQSKTERQVFKAAYLRDEYLPEIKNWALDALKREERFAFRRLGSVAGIEKVIYRDDIASSPAGRAFLRNRFKKPNAT